MESFLHLLRVQYTRSLFIRIFQSPFQTSSVIEDLRNQNDGAPILINSCEDKFASHGCWYIIVDTKIITLGEMEAETAFEILFDVYYIFNLKYQKTCARIFNFLESYYYCIEGVNPLGVVAKYYNMLK